MNAEASITEQLTRIKSDWAMFPVERVWLFGSRARGTFAQDSDWDFLVQFSRPPNFGEFMGLRERLAERLRGAVDILSVTACKPRFLQAIEKELVDVA